MGIGVQIDIAQAKQPSIHNAMFPNDIEAPNTCHVATLNNHFSHQQFSKFFIYIRLMQGIFHLSGKHKVYTRK